MALWLPVPSPSRNSGKHDKGGAAAPPLFYLDFTFQNSYYPHMSMEQPEKISSEEIKKQTKSIAEKMAEVRQNLAPLTGNTEAERLQVSAEITKEKADRDAKIRDILKKD